MILKALKTALVGGLVLGLGIGAATWFARAEKPDDDTPALVPGGGVRVSAATAAKLGVQTGEAKPRAAGKPRALQLSGSTALDPARMSRVQGRFVPFEVVEIGRLEEEAGARSVRAGDRVSKGGVLAVVTSADVASQKADLFDAAVLLKLDEAILDRATAAGGAVTEVFVLSAKRNVAADRNAVRRAENGLKKLGISESDIEAVRKEARTAADTPKADTEDARAARLKEWSKVVLKAPADGIIVERNAQPGEVVTDATVNLFTIADVDRLLVIVNVPEDDLPGLNALAPADRRWTVSTAGVSTAASAIDDIGYLIDPATRTAVAKGTIENAGHQFRAGQFVTASVALVLAADEVSVPATAVVEEKGQTFVFVQPDAKKPIYELRSVIVVRRGSDAVHVRTKLTGDEKRRGRQALRPGEPVVTAGALELKGLLEDLKAD